MHCPSAAVSGLDEMIVFRFKVVGNLDFAMTVENV